jgi:hypothetical protein
MYSSGAPLNGVIKDQSEYNAKQNRRYEYMGLLDISFKFLFSFHDNQQPVFYTE